MRAVQLQELRGGGAGGRAARRGAMSRPGANARPAGAVLAGLLTGVLLLAATVPAAAQRNNVILFVGDGMDVSTVTFSRIAGHGVDGDLFMDRMPYTALSRTSSADNIVGDSPATMSAMMTGVNTNGGVIGYPPTTERFDFNLDGDGTPLTNVAELAKSLGYAVGIVTTATVTHATPAAVYAHVNNRGREDDVAAQLVPGGRGYNARLKSGLLPLPSRPGRPTSSSAAGEGAFSPGPGRMAGTCSPSCRRRAMPTSGTPPGSRRSAPAAAWWGCSTRRT